MFPLITEFLDLKKLFFMHILSQICKYFPCLNYFFILLMMSLENKRILTFMKFILFFHKDNTLVSSENKDTCIYFFQYAFNFKELKECL